MPPRRRPAGVPTPASASAAQGTRQARRRRRTRDGERGRHRQRGGRASTIAPRSLRRGLLTLEAPTQPSRAGRYIQAHRYALSSPWPLEMLVASRQRRIAMPAASLRRQRVAQDLVPVAHDHRACRSQTASSASRRDVAGVDVVQPSASAILRARVSVEAGVCAISIIL